MAVLLNLLFNELKFARPKKDAPEFVAAPPRMVREVVVRGLRDDDHYAAGKLIDADGAEVLIVSNEEFSSILRQ